MADSYPDSSVSVVRLYIFFIFGGCVGLPALVWTLHRLYFHRKIRGRISAFIFILLITDLTQLLLNVIILTQMDKILNTDFELHVFWVWSALDWCGVQLHQLVALEGVLTLNYPQHAARIFSCPTYMAISVLGFVFF